MTTLQKLDLIDNPDQMYPLAQIDCRDGSWNAWTQHNGETGVPPEVYHGFVLEFSLPTYPDGERLTALMQSGEVQALIARMVAGSESNWDGHNHVNQLTADADRASDELEQILLEAPELIDGGWYDAGDWYSMYDVADELNITGDTTDEELSILATREIEAAAADNWVVDGISNYLTARRDELKQE